jgi:outer membrane protein OmpA-like peptidoglycan-associated protein
VVADAKSALSALVPGKFSADDLVKALNLMAVHFDTGSATISADSLDVLTAAANALKAAPAGSKVEIGGYTDNTGDAAANLKLSDDRANAVRSKLVELGVSGDILVAKGYGDANPVADNATEDGRAKNRRMEFTVPH